ncbi:MAG: acetate kinase [Clostridiaceae bacterium]|nr:acetate kinase [Clostridiaceae bacterium]
MLKDYKCNEGKAGDYILALNCGSSSAKFNLFTICGQNRLEPYIQGIASEIGNSSSKLKYSFNGEKHEIVQPINSHREALMLIFEEFYRHGISTGSIRAVGHRTVHGGEKYRGSVLVDKKVMETLRSLVSIAPLHNPPNITGIEEAMKLLPGIPQVAVFDTAFHSSLPDYAFRYAIPDDWYFKYGVRKYGFHGTSHMYVSKRAAKALGIPYNEFCCITAHLGNGCSITKICRGKSVDTSMGFTPLEGVVMGTRSGDIDPALIEHVAREISTRDPGVDEAEAYRKVMHALNKESGLKALGCTNMMQDLRQRALNGDEAARLAIKIYAYRIAKYIASYWATMPCCHAIVFTAGVGENEGYVRKEILSFLENLKIVVDEEKNAIRGEEIIIGSSNAIAGSPLSIMVVPTNEEIVIGYDALYIGFLSSPVPEVYPFEY